MPKEIIHFSHANGFPAESYRKFFHYLQDKYQIGYINMHGHSPDYPVTENWPHLVKELIHYLEKTYIQPVIGLGHSLGGGLTYMAALERPELFKCVIMLDTPIPGYFGSLLALVAKKLHFIDQVTPAHKSKNRRIVWETFNAAVDYFRPKSLFKDFDTDCLEDYVRYGTEKTAHGIQLKFRRDIEYQIFRTMPTHLAGLRRRLKVPGALIYGKYSRVISRSNFLFMKNHLCLRCISFDGGHLFPFEKPQQAARAVQQVVSKF